MVNLNFPDELKALLWIVFIFSVGILAPLTLALGGQSILDENIAQSINLFSTLLIAGSVISLIIFFVRRIWKKDDKYGNGFGFFNLGESPASPFFKRFTAPQLVLGSLIIFSVLFLVVNSIGELGGGLTGLKTLPTQQFSPGQSLAFSTLLIPASEEMFSLAFTGIFALILVIVALKTNMTKTTFNTLYFAFIPLAISIFAVIWHTQAYAGLDLNLLSVGIFWFLKTIFILVTGLFMLGWVLHLTNNFFIDFTRLYSSDFVLFTMIGIIFALIVLYVFIYRGRIFGKKPIS